MTINQFAENRTTQAFRWELTCAGVEILGVSVGLWLTLNGNFAQLGATFLFFVCMVSILVRMQRYSSLK